MELRLPHEPHNVLKEDYSQTILELGFLPRTKFIVTALDANQMENSKLVKVSMIIVSNCVSLTLMILGSCNRC